MQVILPVVSQIGVLFTFILIGFVLCRFRLVPNESSVVFSKLENKIFMPAVIINTFWTNCTIKNISEKWVYMLYSTVLLMVCIVTGFIISRFLTDDEYLKKIYRYSISVANFGFVGTAMVSGIYGADSIELFDYMMFTLPLNMFTYSVGIAWLMPNNKGLSLKNFTNPIFISLFIGGALGLLSVPRIDFANTIISNAAACMSPIAMLLTGIVIGSYEFKDLLSRWQTYVIAGIRLVGFPLLFISSLRLFGAEPEIIIAALSAHAMPLGLNTVIIPSAYGEDPKAGASLALVSQVTSVVTIPIMFMIANT